MKMKIQIELTSAEEERIVIYCKEITDEIKRIKQALEHRDKTLLGFLEDKSVVLKPEEILYFEAVDKKVFAYTKDCCYRMNQSLELLEELYEGLGFFRCSKAMIVNLQFISHFQSLMGNRIIATLENGEEVIVSRHYAKILRQRL